MKNLGKSTAPKASKADKKIAYDAKLCPLLDEYTQILVVGADNVGSKQLQNIRKGLRGDSVVLMGKNTMMKRSVRIHAQKTGNEAFLNIIPLLVGNVGAHARVGLVAPVDVVVPPGNTGLDPSQTSFFQVLNIPTKINKGIVEIITPIELIKKGDKVGSSEAALLAKLDDLVAKFAVGVSMVTSLSLALSYPTLAAAPHMFINAYKNVLAIALETEYSFPQADKVKDYLADPSKFVAAAALAVTSDSGAVPAAAAVEEKKEEPAEESDDDMDENMNLTYQSANNISSSSVFFSLFSCLSSLLSHYLATGRLDLQYKRWIRDKLQAAQPFVTNTLN
ncbi:60S acidic ribosomal protein P0 [Heracleum sosnowskyi]|uniref:60S acidic ribosomal protein P0 n=1 Tax=Heracleum sosnowskyi TaxID=360622 RepID=A0AAD8MN41_9APIA|nr:60S acidic ribosomal protein P0 [Heracleum sosnowskyi]